MATIINIANYRKRARKVYMAKYGAKIERLVAHFLRHNLECDFQQLAEDYQSSYQGDMVPWDYVHFRDILAEALDQVYGKALYDLLRAQPWFDSSLVRQDEIVDLCLTTYVLGHCNIAAKT